MQYFLLPPKIGSLALSGAGHAEVVEEWRINSLSGASHLRHRRGAERIRQREQSRINVQVIK